MGCSKRVRYTQVFERWTLSKLFGFTFWLTTMSALVAVSISSIWLCSICTWSKMWALIARLIRAALQAAVARQCSGHATCSKPWRRISKLPRLLPYPFLFTFCGSSHSLPVPSPLRLLSYAQSSQCSCKAVHSLAYGWTPLSFYYAPFPAIATKTTAPKALNHRT